MMECAAEPRWSEDSDRHRQMKEPTFALFSESTNPEVDSDFLCRICEPTSDEAIGISEKV